MDVLGFVGAVDYRGPRVCHAGGHGRGSSHGAGSMYCRGFSESTGSSSYPFSDGVRFQGIGSASGGGGVSCIGEGIGYGSGW